jgi:hypothetical protein
MAADIKDNSKMVKNMVKDLIFGQMAAIIQEDGPKIN